MKLIYTRTNQLRYLKRYNTVRNYQDRVYEFGVFYDSYIIYRNWAIWGKLEYNYQFKDSFSLHLMSLITDNPLGVNSLIALLNYHNCLYYNHTKFGLNDFTSYKTLCHEKQNKPILNHIYDIMIRDYKFNYNINFTFNFNPEFGYKLLKNKVYIDTSDFYNKEYKIIDFANQDLINMVYEISQQNKKIEKKLTFMVIYNLFLR